MSANDEDPRPGKSNPDLDALLTQIKLIKDRVRGVVYGISNGMYLHGRPGTAKTHSVMDTLKTLAVNYSYNNGHMTPIGLFDVIEANADRVIILDDVSSLFNQPIAIQILLAALGTPHTGSRARIVQYKTAKETRTVRFTGGMILISNLSLNGHQKEVLSALRDRVNVINYEPTDEQIIALIFCIAAGGVRGLTPDEASMVAQFTVGECKRLGIRPSVRLFMDKAIVDYQLWKAGRSELHWKDLVASTIEQSLIELTRETRDLSRREMVEAEQRIAVGIYLEFDNMTERVETWKLQTGKSQAAFYRRLKEARENGLLPPE